ncbi:polysaccharide pyruvyl transferase family protein [Mycobacterium sp. SMC-4]|uniref:polysaccharide pyruvyl transferase family protein n=1 Tax=Mycobacterium sp. SMC-4 TaxID=2857059 RepID=UPI0021B41A64|nr:polysaccharide pyruvyl transferase family protein [Mycobacterium sp. SMC-4]UXA20020.1 polysaccharide pyruvyl transferase family protein [Mycobacterium sp. SMC-4]
MTPTSRADAHVASADHEIIYLLAPCGHPNYGDEFIVRAWLRHLARVRPRAEVIVDCHTPGQAAVLLADAHPTVTFVDTMWRICFQTAELPISEAVAVASAVVSDPGRMPTLVSGIELLTRADSVHLVGGGYINAVWPHHLVLVATAAAVAERSGARLFATGQGLIPVGGPERQALLIEAAQRFDKFDVRDDSSYDALVELGESRSHTGDDAWLGVNDPDVYDQASEAVRRDVVLCLQSDLMEDFAGGRGIDGLVEVASELVKTWRLDGADVAFVEGIPGADRVVFDRIAHLLPGIEFVPFSHLWRAGLPARPGQTWVTTRFHHHLLAAARGASGIALAGRTDYYPLKHLTLARCGSRWLVTGSGDLPDAPVRAGGFASETVEAMARRKCALADELYPRRPRGLRRVVRALRAASPG